MKRSISIAVLALALANAAMADAPASQTPAAQDTSNLQANLRDDASASRRAASANANECSVYRAGPRDTIRRCK
jgi:hypothetical protein